MHPGLLSGFAPAGAVGILFGQESTFPPAFIERVNARGGGEIHAGPVRIEKVIQGEACGYDVIIDRISQDVPFYRGFLKNAALTGTAVINNPFWWSADEKFFNNALATQIGVEVPRTVLLPSHDHPPDTSANSFRNLAYPMDWEAIFHYVGWKNVYKLHDAEEFFRAYHETGQLVMMLQEEVVFEQYFRCYCLDTRHVHIMPYEPRNPFHDRYKANFQTPPELLARVERDVLTLNQYLGYDFNTVEFAVRDGVPLAIDFCNPAPDADIHSVGPDNFEWIVENAAQMAIRKAREHVPGRNNLTWGKFVQTAAAGKAS